MDSDYEDELDEDFYMRLYMNRRHRFIRNLMWTSSQLRSFSDRRYELASHRIGIHNASFLVRVPCYSCEYEVQFKNEWKEKCRIVLRSSWSESSLRAAFITVPEDDRLPSLRQLEHVATEIYLHYAEQDRCVLQQVLTGCSDDLVGEVATFI